MCVRDDQPTDDEVEEEERVHSQNFAPSWLTVCEKGC